MRGPAQPPPKYRQEQSRQGTWQKSSWCCLPVWPSAERCCPQNFPGQCLSERTLVMGPAGRQPTPDNDFFSIIYQHFLSDGYLEIGRASCRERVCQYV